MPKKGVSDLIKSLNIVKYKLNDVSLVIIGDGPEKESLLRITDDLQLNNSIQFIESLPHQELAKWYNRATIAVFPFQQAESGDIEGLGLVMIEAMGCECPVIAGDVPAVHDVIKHNENGLIVNSKNEILLAKNIFDLLTNPKKAKIISQTARKYVVNHFSWEKSANEFKNLIHSQIKLSNKD